jgi:hypothetical protein
MSIPEKASESAKREESQKEKANDSGETTRPGKRTIQVLVFAAGLLIGPLLALGSTTIGRINAYRPIWEKAAGLPPLDLFVTTNVTSMQAYLKYYFSTVGFVTLIPLDIILLIYIGAVLLAIVTIKILAVAQLAEDPNRVDALVLRADKYLGWILSLLVFFMIFEYGTSVELIQILSSGNFLIFIAIGLAATVVVSYYIRRVIVNIERAVAKR